MPQHAAQTTTERLRAWVENHTCAVLGYGTSNRPLVEQLCALGARTVTVRDQRTFEKMEADGDVARLSSLGATLICGPAYLDGLDAPAPDLIFRSPGIRPDKPEILRAVAAGARLTSEMELFLSVTPATVIAISGSDGKTTTTTLTARLLEAAATRTGVGKVFLGGNIGTPLLPLVESMTRADIAVVELSSFQLMTLPAACIPTRAALTNITPNHLNWHTDMAEYIAAKARLLGVEGSGPRMAVLNARDAVSRELAPALASALAPDYPIVWFSGETDLAADWTPAAFRAERGDAVVFELNGTIVSRTSDGVVTPLLASSRIRLPGRHNMENFMAALALTAVSPAGLGALVTPADAAAVADAFTGVPHRLEFVGTVNGAACYNSSIDSSPSRTVAALHAMRELNGRSKKAFRDPIVICGGQDKHLPFDPLADALCAYASAVVLTGEARGQIMEALEACPAYDPARLPVTVIPDYREAMKAACRMATPGDTVLLSPACTSFDAFRNFEERGDEFRRVVSGQGNAT